MTQTVDIKKEAGTVEGGGMGVSSSLSLGSATKPVLGTKNGLSGGKGEDTKTHTHTHTHTLSAIVRFYLYLYFAALFPFSQGL